MSKVLFLSNDFITLYSYRKELIKILCDRGEEVYLSLSAGDENSIFEKMGCKIVETPIDKKGVNPVNDIKLLFAYIKIMREIKPDIIFSYTIKPNIYGTMASNFLKLKQICNITGTGATFLNNNYVNYVAKILYKFSIKNCYKVFFQNTGNRDFFVKHGMVKNNFEMLPGSGCNMDEHLYSDMPEDSVVRFIFIGRVMYLKGVDEYLEAAKIIKQKYPNTEFLIAGSVEEEKYKEIVSEYEKDGYVQNLGYRKDVADLIAKCHCVVLPSHGGEGIPNVLLESSATGRACIGSKIDGTTSVIDDEITGYLFEPGNANDLVNKLEKFISLTYDNKKQMGIEGRKKIESQFDRKIVIQKYLDEIKACGEEK